MTFRSPLLTPQFTNGLVLESANSFGPSAERNFRYGSSMSDDSFVSVGEGLGFTDEFASLDELIRVIDRELAGLQIPEPSPQQHERQVALLAARHLLTGQNQKPSSELVQLSMMSAIEKLVDLAVAASRPPASNPTTRPDPAVVMRTNVKAAAMQATSDFRRGRTLPFAGVGAIVGAILTARGLFGVGEVQIDPALFYSIAAAALGVSVLGYTFLRFVQNRAERVLRRLYDVEVQEEALELTLREDVRHFLANGIDRRLGRSRYVTQREDEFSPFQRGDYREALAILSGLRRSHALPLGLFSLSTVDFDSALDDAAGLALERLIDLNILEGVIVRGRLMYRAVRADSAQLTQTDTPRLTDALDEQ